MIPAKYLDILRLIRDRLKNQPVVWVITGSVGMALQEMDIEVHDIDLQTDKEGAYLIEDCLKEFVVQEVEIRSNERMRSYFGKLCINGMQVDLIGDFQKLNDITWDEPPDLVQLRRWVEVDRMNLPVLDLEYEWQAYLKMGRIEKAEKIRRFLDQCGDQNKVM